MNKLIDPVLHRAIRELVDSRGGGQSEVARLSGITQKQISNYISAKTRTMNETSWEKLYPHLKQFLPAEYISRQEDGNSRDASGELVSRKLLISRILQDGSLEDSVKLQVIGIINSL